MKTKFVFFCSILILTSTHLIAQNPAPTKQDTIQLKSGTKFIGKILKEEADSIQIKTEDFGIITIATKNVYKEGLISVETRDGNTFVGRVTREDQEFLYLKTENLSNLKIPKNYIKQRTELEGTELKDGEYWFQNPQSTRYFWAPNAYGVKKGEGYYQNIWVLWNQVNYGLTDQLSIGAGVIPTFLFAGAPTPVFATTKLAIPLAENKVNLATGVIAGSVIGGDVGLFGMAFGTSTFGTPDNNVSLGLGYVFGEGEFVSTPLVNLSGLFRLSPKGYLITENYGLISEGVGLIGIGGRWIPKKVSLDLLLVSPIGAGGFVALPIIGISIPL